MYEPLYYIYKKWVVHILNLSTLFVMKLCTCNGLFIICNHANTFMSNEFSPPYIMPHVVFKNCTKWTSFSSITNGLYTKIEHILIKVGIMPSDGFFVRIGLNNNTTVMN